MYNLTKYLGRGHDFMEPVKEETTWKSGKNVRSKKWIFTKSNEFIVLEVP
jgi:hypothetical protein